MYEADHPAEHMHHYLEEIPPLWQGQTYQEFREENLAALFLRHVVRFKMTINKL
ncbi:MAG: hypothetical protein ACI8RD_011372 [Bacillariaceae sp.]|jgi:hypothetical protein